MTTPKVSLNLTVVVLSAFIVMVPVAMAQESTPEQGKIPQLFQLEEIEITAAEAKTNVETPNMTVIKPEILLQGIGTTLDAALRRQPGVDVQRLQEVGGALDDDSIKVRGFGARRILVTIDGRPLRTPGTAGGYFIDWTTIPLNNVEKIELIKGVSDPRYGNTLGGVINLVTKKAAPKPKFEVQGSVASYSTKTANFFHAWKPGAFEYAVSGGFSESDGYLWNGNFRIKNFNAMAGYNFPWHGKLFANVQLIEVKKGFLVNNRNARDYDSPLYNSPVKPNFPPHDGDTMYGGMGFRGRPEPGSYWLRDRILLDVGYEQQVFSHGLLKLRYWKNWGEREAFNTWALRNRIFHKKWWDDVSYGADLSYRHTFNHHTVNFGVDYQRYKDKGDKLFPDDWRYPNPAVAKRNENYVNSEILGFFLMDDITFKENFILTPGLRYSWMEANPGPAGKSAPDLIRESLSQRGIAPSLKFTYLFGSDSLAYVSVARALRLATPPEYYWHYTQDNQPYTTLFANIPLKKEDGVLFQGGVKYNRGGNTYLELSPYCYLVNDYIHFDLINFVSYNIDRAVIYGLECQVAQKLPYGFTIFANYTFQKSKTSGDPFVAQFVAPQDRGFNQIPGLPPHKVNAGIQYKGSRFKEKIALYLNYVSAQQVIYNNNNLFDTNQRVRTQPAYVTVDVEGSLPIGKNIVLTGYVYNLFDRKYQERFGYPAARLNFGGGLKVFY